jgi:flagellar basal body rod protein FlgG
MTQAVAQIGSSVDVLTRELEIIANNVANANTTGFKRLSNAFSKVLDSQKGTADTYSPGTIDLKSGLDFSQGNMVQTGRSMDFALSGSGFFVVETQDGPLYTRNGVFSTNQNGQIVDEMGRTVEGESGPITLPSGASVSAIHVTSGGEITAGGASIGKFKVVDFKDSDESKLVSIGNNCFAMSDNNVRPTSATNVVVKQGFQESSNVKIVDEMVDMVMITRLYEANMRYVTAQKENANSLTSVAMG